MSQIDLRRFTAEEVVRYPSSDLLILGTVAIQVGDEIWVGGVAEGDMDNLSLSLPDATVRLEQFLHLEFAQGIGAPHR